VIAREPTAPGAPLVLALETATARASVSLVRGDGVLDELALPRDRPVSEQLLPGVDALLARAGVRLADVGAFAVGIGPGSFTGLRVGIATVKGLAFGGERLAAPVPTLEALAAWAVGAVRGAGPVVAMLDAQRGEVYSAAFDPTPGGLRPRLAEGLYGVEELTARLPRAGLFVGDGARLHAARLRERLGAGIEIAEDLAAPRAREVGLLGARILAQGGGVDPALLVPRYLRRAEAEARRTGERTEARSEATDAAR
jgi:tRNA threonylcarbamoyladenosine biosynthesis protein TsaB